jgi:hypothetical protein
MLRRFQQLMAATAAVSSVTSSSVNSWRIRQADHLLGDLVSLGGPFVEPCVVAAAEPIRQHAGERDRVLNASVHSLNRNGVRSDALDS